MTRFSIHEAVELFLFVAVLNVIAFLGTAALHELGHAALGVVSGCTDITVVFEVVPQSVYTRMRCASPPSPQALFVSSYIFTAPLALLLLSLRDVPERFLGLLVLGGNVAGSVTDIGAFADPAVSVFLLAVSIALMIRGEDLIVRSLMARQTPGEGLYGNRYKDGGQEEGQDDGEDDDVPGDVARRGGDAAGGPDAADADAE